MLRAALLALLLPAAPALAEIAVQDPYAITPVPGAPTGAAYMLIRNDGSEPDRLLGARTPVARAAELHHHIEEDGVMRMRPIEGGLELPAGGELLLGRGGAHVMLMGLEEPLADGMTFPLTLLFEEAGEVEVEISVDLARLTGEADSHDHGEEAHGGAAQDHADGAQDHGEATHDHAEGEDAGHEGH